MTLTEEQLAEARAELMRREVERSKQYEREYALRQREADSRHQAQMEAKYPGISWDTMYDIYSDMRDYYE